VTVLTVLVFVACGVARGPRTRARVQPIAVPGRQPIGDQFRTSDGIGLPGPLVVEQIARDGSWIVICQAIADTNRDGRVWGACGLVGAKYDDAETRLYLADGAALPIDQIIAASRDGQRLVVIVTGDEGFGDGFLIDVSRHTITKLPAFNGSYLGARFTEDGEHVAYTSEESVVLLDVQSGRAALSPVPGAFNGILDITPDGDRVLLVTRQFGIFDGSGAPTTGFQRTVRWFELDPPRYEGSSVTEPDDPSWRRGHLAPELVDGQPVFATDSAGRRLVASGTFEDKSIDPRTKSARPLDLAFFPGRG
jgi:hypothetical protein